MENIPTAEELLIKHADKLWDGKYLLPSEAKKLMISFANLHIQAALEAAGKVDIKVEKKSVFGKYRKWRKVKEGEDFDLFTFEMRSTPDKKGILNCYPLDKVK